MADQNGSSCSTPAPYMPPHLRTGFHLPTSEKISVLHQSAGSIYHSQQINVTDPSQEYAPKNSLRPSFSMTCFDAGNARSPSCIEGIRLQVVPSCQETWSPDDYLRGHRQALCFYSSRVALKTPELTSGISSEVTESSAGTLSASNSSRESQSSVQVHKGFAGDWNRTSYEEILLKSLMELAENSARCLPCTNHAKLAHVKERVSKVYTKIDKCFFRVSIDLQGSTLSISELGELFSNRQVSHQSVARAISSGNIINGRKYLLKSGIYEDTPQQYCKIVIVGSDRDSYPENTYRITLRYEADATAPFPEQEVQGNSSELAFCSESEKLKSYSTWRETSTARLRSISIKKPPYRHCFVHFLRQKKGSDFRLRVNREVTQTEVPFEAEIRAWVKQAWAMRSEKGVLNFPPFKRFRIGIVRYLEFMETFKSKEFKVKMYKVTQSKADTNNMTSDSECLLQSFRVNEFRKGIEPNEVGTMVSLVHELVEETARLTLAMGDVNFVC